MNIVRRKAANDNGRAELVLKIVEALRVGIAGAVPNGLAFEDEGSILLEATNGAVRAQLAKRLRSLSEGFGDEIKVDGILYRRHHPGSARYFSLCGVIDVQRWTYRRVGQRNGPTVVPIELAAGLVQCATPALGYALAHGAAQGPIRDVESNLIASHRRPPSRSTIDKIARAVGTTVNQQIERIEAKVRTTEEVPSGSFAINVGLDRTSVPMEEFEKVIVDGKPKSRVSVRYRMGFVGTVAITNAECEPLLTRRYAVPAHEGAEGVVRRMVADVKHAMRSRPDLNIGIVQDGAIDVWCHVRDAFKADEEIKAKGWRETVDRYHATQRLAACLDILFPDDPTKRHRKLAEWKDALNRRAYAIRGIELWLQWETHLRPLKTQAAMSKALGAYFFEARHFRYATLRKLGLHEASGVTEGACKSLITMRAKRSGQRWRKPGISAVLALRSLLNSDRLPAFWSIFKTQFRAECMNAA